MSRIIAGLVGSLRLASPANVTRPTADRVKESLFSALESIDAIAGSRVLDLFAGTAALGLEAISRGSASLVAVEKSKRAASVCQKNIEVVKSAMAKQNAMSEIELVCKDAEAYLKSTKSKFDLVLLDPPYEMKNQKLTELSQMLSNCLADQALVVVERSSRELAPELVGLALESQRTYGDTSVYFFRVSAR